ncbi:MAG: DUF423 domain-containing protein [Gammaproteobacteria bacterium]|nr:DUF423 domain-containing protein [Gammaproteobacteria bacterium]
MLKTFVLFGSLSALLAVVLGAFGAHGLKQQLSPEMLSVYQTGVDYHMWHALGLVLIGLLGAHYSGSALLTWAGWFMLAGIMIFSGSLYILSITGVRWLGAITPFGGLAFIVAWALLIVAVWRA